MNSKFFNALGLCKRAGKCLIGDFACEKAVKGKKAFLLVMDAQASEATKNRYEGFCSRAGLPLVTAADIGRAVGRPESRIVAVMEPRFAEMIQKAWNEEHSIQGE